jgi:hypothetical protein
MREQTVVMLGAGSAGIGVCEQVVRSMMADGLSGQDARSRIFVVDLRGLLTTDRKDLTPAQRRFARLPAAVPSREPGRPRCRPGSPEVAGWQLPACPLRARPGAGAGYQGMRQSPPQAPSAPNCATRALFSGSGTPAGLRVPPGPCMTARAARAAAYPMPARSRQCRSSRDPLTRASPIRLFAC